MSASPRDGAIDTRPLLLAKPRQRVRIQKSSVGYWTNRAVVHPKRPGSLTVRTSLAREIAMVVSGIGPWTEYPAFLKRARSALVVIQLTVAYWPRSGASVSARAARKSRRAGATTSSTET